MMQIIAEVKTHSPFGHESSKTWDELFEIANDVGDIISVHTDPRWHGSFELIKKARALTKKPILAKGIHANDSEVEQAVDAGADYVLVVGRVPGVHLVKSLIEPNSLEELGNLPPDVKAVWNSRDLSSGGLKNETFTQARQLFPGWLVQASNIAAITDINPEAEAILVGTHLAELAQYRDSIKNL